jgi:hypothetical protein
MLIESEHSMAREHSDGSATEIDFMAFVSFVGGVFCKYKSPETDVLGSRQWWELTM